MTATGAETNSADDTTRIVDESARGLYFIAGTYAIVGLFGRVAMVFDAAMVAGLALWMQRSRSRAPAIILVAMGGGGLAVASMNLMGLTARGGRSFLVAGLLVWLALRALRAMPRTEPSAGKGNADHGR